MPPAIQSRMTVSAVGAIFSSGFVGEEARRAGGQRAERGGGRGLEEIAAGVEVMHGGQLMSWNSGRFTSAHRKSAMPSALRLLAEQFERWLRVPRRWAGGSRRGGRARSSHAAGSRAASAASASRQPLQLVVERRAVGQFERLDGRRGVDAHGRDDLAVRAVERDLQRIGGEQRRADLARRAPRCSTAG